MTPKVSLPPGQRSSARNRLGVGDQWARCLGVVSPGSIVPITETRLTTLQRFYQFEQRFIQLALNHRL